MRRWRGLAFVALVAGCARPGHSPSGKWRTSADANANEEVPPPVIRESRPALERAGFVLVDGAQSPNGRAAPSFHRGYTALFQAHQPVYVTADAVLYAWHSSYDKVLAFLERSTLVPALGQLLTALKARAVDPDVARYLSVGQALLDGSASSDVAVQNARAATGPGVLDIFGAEQRVDYSMFKPRGHYSSDEAMRRYFQAMSWLGRIEFRIAEPDERGVLHDKPRAIAALDHLHSLFGPNEQKAWNAIDQTLTNLVGPPDDRSIFNRTTKPHIRSQLRQPGADPVAVLFLSQRYVFDSHVFNDVTYGALETKRMMPTPLDIAATVFENATARTLLAHDIKRYGKEYEVALDGMVRARKGAGDVLWRGSVYHLWLQALKELSPDAERDRGLPAPFNGEAWSRRLLNTQLGSWAELRHDNILYAKQSFTAEALCEYPDGYVEPYPKFWATLADMAVKERSTVVSFPLPIAEGSKRTLVSYFDRFIEIVNRLRLIADHETKNEPLTSADLDFLNRMASIDGKSSGCTTKLVAEGWDADLYFDPNDAIWHNPVVADVHTQPTDEWGTQVGHVLHVGTSAPRLMVVKVQHDGGAHTQTYRGYVSTYSELTTKNFERLDDDQWARLRQTFPPPPPWLEDVVSAKP